MTVQRLRELVPPPVSPVATGSPQQWRQVEAFFGLTLPDDYRELVQTYGAGQFAGFITLFTPFINDPYANLLAQRDLNLRAYQTVRAQFPEAAPFPAYPEPGGVLPWAQTGNGDVLYWLTEGPSAAWPIILMESRHGAYERRGLSTSDFLVDFCEETLRSRILPDDLLEDGPPRFASLPG